MQTFKTYISINGESLVFTFNKTFTINGLSYMVTASDYNKHFYLFYMHQGLKHWTIAEPARLPHHILELEEELSNTIAKYQ